MDTSQKKNPRVPGRKPNRMWWCGGWKFGVVVELVGRGGEEGVSCVRVFENLTECGRCGCVGVAEWRERERESHKLQSSKMVKLTQIIVIMIFP